MKGLLALAMIAGSLPGGVSSGPETAESAQVVDAPIDEVTVFSDRARVRRRTRMTLPAGTRAMRLPDLPGAVMMETIRVSAEGAKVLRVESTPVERERMSIEQVEKLIVQLEEITDRLASLDARKEVLQNELNMLAGVSPAMPTPEKDRVGKPMPAVQPVAWKTSMDYFEKRREKVRGELRGLEEQRTKLVVELRKVQREAGRYNLGAFSDRKVQVLAIVQSGGGVANLELEYFVPGARWWPSYELELDSKSNTMTLNTAGLVEQASGEDWEGVRLMLSTAIPGQSIDLPRLLTWTLGEKKDFLPVPRPDKPLATAKRYPPPQPQPIAAEAERQARIELLQARLGDLGNLMRYDGRQQAQKDAAYRDDMTLDAPAGVGMGGFGGGSAGGAGYGRASRAPSRPSRAKVAEARPSPAPAMERAAADSDYYFDSDEAGGEIQVVATRNADSGPAAARTSLGLFDPTTWRRPTFGDRTLPAMVAGGLDYVYTSPTPATIPSDGRRVQVPLSADTWPAKTRYEATPAIMETAFLTGRVTVGGDRPVLAGPVNIFAGADFVGEGRLETTGPGKELKLPFGADQDIRFTRFVVPRTKTEGVFSKDDVTDYAVTIEVANHKKRAIEIDVFDVLPKTNNEDVKVKLGNVKPALAEKPDGNGVLRWRLEIPAGQKVKIRLDYSIERPADWQLYQR